MNSGKKPSRISILQEYQSFKNINPLTNSSSLVIAPESKLIHLTICLLGQKRSFSEKKKVSK